jgi:Phage portal protein, lambda family
MNFLQRLIRRVRGPRINFGQLLDAAAITDTRPFMGFNNLDQTELVSEFDLRMVRSASRKLFANLGPARAPILQRATYAFGQAWVPVFTGEDKAWGEVATKLLVDETLKICDARGENFSFVTGLFLDSVTIDRDGDIGILFTETEDGYPQFQRVLGHRIGTGEDLQGIVREGPYQGLRINQGVIVNEHERPVAYRILGDTRDEDVDISARDFAFVFDPDSCDQVRGLPVLTHAVNDLLDLMVTQGFEKQASMLASSIGLVEYNESGTSEDFAAMVEKGDGRPTEPVGFKTYFGGLVRYFRANSGGKVDSLKTDRPSGAWDAFMSRLIRNACAGVPWPYELAWDPSQLSGVNARLVLSQAQKAVEDRQALAEPIARRMVGYMIAKLVKMGRLAPSRDWWRWEFTKPGRLIIDYGRDKRADREDWAAGITNLTDILTDQGIDLEEHYRKRAYEIVLRKRIADEVEAETGYPIEDSEMAQMTPAAGRPPPAPRPPGAPPAPPGIPAEREPARAGDWG